MKEMCPGEQMQIGERTYNIKLGLAIFLGISVVSAVVVLSLGLEKSTWSGLRQMRPQYVLIAAALMVTQWLLNALRFQILVNGLAERVSFSTSFKAFMANVFLAAMTPSQTGGGPLQIYILNRAGVPIAKAFAGCLMGAVLSVFCLVVANVALLGLRTDLRIGLGHHVGAVFSVALAVFLALAVLFLASLFKMKWLKRGLGGLVLFFSRSANPQSRHSMTRRLLRGLDQYSESMRAFAGAKRYRVIVAGLVTMSGISINALIAPVLVAGLNIHAPTLQVFLMQFVIFFITYFSPTPGASGVAELSAYWIIASAAGQQNLLGVYTVIWRFFTSFLGVGVGALVVLSLIGKRSPPAPY